MNIDLHRKIISVIFVLYFMSGLPGVLLASKLDFNEGAAWGLLLLTLALSLWSLVIAIATFKQYQWQYYVGIPFSVLTLVKFPLGTAAGIYYLWYWRADVKKQTEQEPETKPDAESKAAD